MEISTFLFLTSLYTVNVTLLANNNIRTASMHKLKRKIFSFYKNTNVALEQDFSRIFL